MSYDLTIAGHLRSQLPVAPLSAEFGQPIVDAIVAMAEQVTDEEIGSMRQSGEFSNTGPLYTLLSLLNTFTGDVWLVMHGSEFYVLTADTATVLPNGDVLYPAFERFFTSVDHTHMDGALKPTQSLDQLLNGLRRNRRHAEISSGAIMRKAGVEGVDVAAPEASPKPGERRVKIVST